MANAKPTKKKSVKKPTKKKTVKQGMNMDEIMTKKNGNMQSLQQAIMKRK